MAVNLNRASDDTVRERVELHRFFPERVTLLLFPMYKCTDVFNYRSIIHNLLFVADQISPLLILGDRSKNSQALRALGALRGETGLAIDCQEPYQVAHY